MWLLSLVIFLFLVGTISLAIDIYLENSKAHTSTRFIPAPRPPLTLTRTYEDVTDEDIAYEYEFLEK
jgi:hypothetical protein